MTDSLNILITSVGRRSYMIDYFKTALKGSGSVHAGNSVMTYAMQRADHMVITPLIYADDYVDSLLSYCRKWNIRAVLSLLDIDLPILARSKSRFREIGVELLVPEADVADTCNDKWRTCQFLHEHGIPTPATFVTLADARCAIANRDTDYPLVVKPRWGLGSIGIFYADNERELDVLYEKCRREVGSSTLRYESRQDPDRSVLLQAMLTGDEYGLDVLNDLNGRFLACVAKKKIAMRAGETDAAEIVEQEELQLLGKSLAGCLGHVANLDVDCFHSSGMFYVLELNCRFGGQYPFSHLAGADFPGAIVAMLRGEDVSPGSLVATPGTIGYKDLRPVLMVH